MAKDSPGEECAQTSLMHSGEVLTFRSSELWDPLEACFGSLLLI